MESLEDTLQEYRASLVDVEAMIEEAATEELLQVATSVWTVIFNSSVQVSDRS